MNACQGNFLVIQWLGLSTFIAVGPGWSLVRELRSRKQHIVVRKRHVELKWNCTIYWDSSFSNTLSLISWYFNHFCFFFWKEILLYFGCQQRWGRAVVVLSLSCVQLLWPHALWPSSLLCPWNFPGKNTRVSCNFILQGSSQPRHQNCISCITGRFFTTEPPGKLCSIISWKSFLTHMHFFLLLASFFH